MIPEEGICRVFQSPDEEGGQWEDTGVEKSIDELENHFAISAQDLQKFTRYYQRKCQPIQNAEKQHADKPGRKHH